MSSRREITERVVLTLIVFIWIFSGVWLRFFRSGGQPMGGPSYSPDDIRRGYTPSIIPRAYETAEATTILVGVLIVVIAWGFHLQRKRALWRARLTGSK